MVVPCLILDVYITPGSDMTQDLFINQIDWVNYVYGVPNTFYGDRTPNPCNIDIRWRFRNDQGEAVMSQINDPFVDQDVLQCIGYEDLNEYFQYWLNVRPPGPGPYGQTDTLDIAVYFVQGPFAGGFVGCAPYNTPNGPVIVISNAPEGQFQFGQTLAHELGHVLLGPEHVDDENNLMYGGASENAYRLTPEQCAQASNSPYFRNCPE
ncbi:hypothetical protein CON94_04155 [Bacillus pseudomycoides]|uniref:ImmA/IrrE family metallo-endopeptidase n=1 Tax=Bacillus pseudomycoides TaxID=64104 RepID=UPI000BECECE1|nr:ImmA/IrrE family metallo-endopeptidase [Bacillus pseudomycoides]PEF76400.1 hypothetical protein CON94_04155 [Bacillus pseudomycoides]PEL86911.1 hypothetical protein CN615_14340 [Bacillus pseudomycoides]